MGRWDGSEWSLIGEIPIGGINALSAFEGAVVAGGTFQEVIAEDGHHVVANNIAAVRDLGWIPLSGSGIEGLSVSALQRVMDDLYVAGEFVVAGRDLDGQGAGNACGVPSVGLAKYVNAATLRIGPDSEFSEQQESWVYPNPVSQSGRLQIYFSLNVSGPVRVLIWDMLGRRVDTADLGWFASGHHGTVIDHLPRSAGQYLFQLILPGQRQNHRIVVTK